MTDEKRRPDLPDLTPKGDAEARGGFLTGGPMGAVMGGMGSVLGEEAKAGPGNGYTTEFEIRRSGR